MDLSKIEQHLDRIATALEELATRPSKPDMSAAHAALKEKQSGLRQEAKAKVISYVRQVGVCALWQVISRTQLSNGTASRALADAIADGALVKIGKGRYAPKYETRNGVVP